MDEWEDVAFGPDVGSVSIEPIGMGAPTAQVDEWEDVAVGPPSPVSSEGAPWWGKAASGYLSGIGQLADFAQMVQNPWREVLPKEQQGLDYGDTIRNLFDTVTGVENSTQIGEGGGIHTAASYLPQAVLGPSSRAANLAQTLFTAGAAGVGREAGGEKGELAGVVASLFGPTVGSKMLTKAGQAMERKSLGASYVDYLKSADDLQSIALPPGDLTSFAARSLDDLIASGKLGNSRNPSKLQQISNAKQKELADAIGDSIRLAEKNNPTVLPSFRRAQDMLDSGAIPADDIPKYEKKLRELYSGIVSEGGGSLRFLQNQKIAIGKKYDKVDKVANEFNRAIYHDIQESIEKVAPEVKGLNNELSKWYVLDGVLKRGLARAENAEPVGWLKSLSRTSGGFGVPIAVTAGSAASGLTIPAAIGAGAVAAAVNSARGASEIGKGVKAMSQTSPGAAREAAALFQSAPTSDLPAKPQKAASRQQEAPQSAPRSLTGQSVDSQKASSKPTPIAEIEKEIDANPFFSAVYEAESDRDPKAKNPKSTAKGAFQLIDSTAKSLGVKDPLDLKENFEGFKKLTEKHSKKFGNDPRVLYAAHFMGQPLLSKVLDGKALDKDEKAIVKEFEEKAFPRFQKILAAKLSA